MTGKSETSYECCFGDLVDFAEDGFQLNPQIITTYLKLGEIQVSSKSEFKVFFFLPSSPMLWSKTEMSALATKPQPAF